MTEAEKTKRRERIQRVAEAKKAAPVKEMTYWITRDSMLSTDGAVVLANGVNVWLIRPKRKYHEASGTATWSAPDVEVQTANGAAKAKFATWSLGTCWRSCKTYPDDDRMCIRIGDWPTPFQLQEFVS